MSATPTPSSSQSPIIRATAAQTVPQPTDLTATVTKNHGNRCPCCRKKLALTDMACRCGIRHCQTHRLPETHACPHDFKTQGRALLATQLERCVGAKLETL